MLNRQDAKKFIRTAKAQRRKDFLIKKIFLCASASLRFKKVRIDGHARTTVRRLCVFGRGRPSAETLSTGAKNLSGIGCAACGAVGEFFMLNRQDTKKFNRTAKAQRRKDFLIKKIFLCASAPLRFKKIILGVLGALAVQKGLYA